MADAHLEQPVMLWLQQIRGDITPRVDFTPFKDLSEATRAYEAYQSVRPSSEPTWFYRLADLEVSMLRRQFEIIEEVREALTVYFTGLLASEEPDKYRVAFLAQPSEANLALDVAKNIVAKYFIDQADFLFAIKNINESAQSAPAADPFAKTADIDKSQAEASSSESRDESDSDSESLILDKIAYKIQQLFVASKDDDQLKKKIAMPIRQPFFDGKLRPLAASGSVYSPPGGSKNHTLLINFSWLLANIHRGKIFAPHSAISEQNMFSRTKKEKESLAAALGLELPEEDLKQDAEKHQISAFAKEIVAAIMVGYAIQKQDDGTIKLIPPAANLPPIPNLKDVKFANIICSDEEIQQRYGAIILAEDRMRTGEIRTYDVLTRTFKEPNALRLLSYQYADYEPSAPPAPAMVFRESDSSSQFPSIAAERQVLQSPVHGSNSAPPAIPPKPPI